MQDNILIVVLFIQIVVNLATGKLLKKIVVMLLKIGASNLKYLFFKKKKKKTQL